jgi:hypothetical protein
MYLPTFAASGQPVRNVQTQLLEKICGAGSGR